MIWVCVEEICRFFIMLSVFLPCQDSNPELLLLTSFNPLAQPSELLIPPRGNSTNRGKGIPRRIIGETIKKDLKVGDLDSG